MKTVLFTNILRVSVLFIISRNIRIWAPIYQRPLCTQNSGSKNQPRYSILYGDDEKMTSKVSILRKRINIYTTLPVFVTFYLSVFKSIVYFKYEYNLQALVFTGLLTYLMHKNCHREFGISIHYAPNS